MTPAVTHFQVGGRWVFDGLSFLYDASRGVVFLMNGSLCLDAMALEDYRDAFGPAAVRRLVRGE